MAVTWLGYGSLVECSNFFEQRLHTFHYDNASATDRIKANNQAWYGINQFNYIGEKRPVHLLLEANPDATEEEIQTAWLSQDGEFPRGASDIVPNEIIWAQFLWAYALLEGRVPDEDLEQLAVTSQAYGGVRQAYDRKIKMDHIALLIPSPTAYRYLFPFFKNDWGFCFVHV